VVAGPALTVASVGDSRAYLVRDGQIRQITTDHTRAAEIKERGLEAGLAIVGRSVLTRSLSAGREEVEPDIFLEQFREGDALLLCSDGLWSSVPAASMLHVVRELSPSSAARKLVQMANRAGGPDNISVIVVRRGTRPASRAEGDTGELRAGS
jgi:protein phosphatase